MLDLADRELSCFLSWWLSSLISSCSRRNDIPPEDKEVAKKYLCSTAFIRLTAVVAVPSSCTGAF